MCRHPRVDCFPKTAHPVVFFIPLIIFINSRMSCYTVSLPMFHVVECLSLEANRKKSFPCWKMNVTASSY